MTLLDEDGVIPQCPLCNRAITLRNDRIEPHKTVAYTGDVCEASGRELWLIEAQARARAHTQPIPFPRGT